jgi:hypothetical protein
MDQSRVRRGDILLPAVARRLRARIVDSNAIDGCIADHTIVILRPRPGAPSTSQLASYFSSATFLEAVEQYASGTISGALRLTPRALAEMPFMVPADADPSDSVIAVMDQAVRHIIRVIARNSAELQKVEWRILEQVLAATFEDFGFDVHLTPAAKDGGKDMILECVERGTRRRYAVEVKHWVSGKQVHGLHLRKFLQVIVNEQHDSGLLLSTSGFALNAYESLIHLEHKRIRMAGRDKILSLCRLFVMRESGLWNTERLPTDILFEQTAAATT